MSSRAPKSKRPMWKCECGENITRPGLCGFCIEQRTRCLVTEQVEPSDSERAPTQHRLEVATRQAGEVRKGKSGQVIAI